MANEKQFQMRVDDEFLDVIDNWRRTQNDLPGRSEAVRRLISLGLEAGGSSWERMAHVTISTQDAPALTLPARPDVELNVREKQIVGHLMQARNNREIAAALHISEKTVKHYMTGLMHKLKARNRVEVAHLARGQDAPAESSDEDR